MIDNRETQLECKQTPRPWSVDRWGRFLSGCSMLALTVLGIVHHPAWFIGALLSSSSLVVTALTDRCLMHDLLIRLGAKEREDLFLPGGKLRHDAAQHASQSTVRTTAPYFLPTKQRG